MKKILVVSHERSGTHFCINTIAANFPQYSDHKIDVLSKADIRSMLDDPQTERPYKAHHQYWFFEEFMEEIVEKCHIFYVMREGMDVMVSSWLYHKSVEGKPGFFPVADTIGEWMRLDPTEYPFDQPYSVVKSFNMPARWSIHVKGWLNSDCGGTVISYRDLSMNFMRTVVQIGNVLGEDPLKFEKPDLMNSRSIYPRKGIVGDWMNEMTEDDVAYFEEQAR